MRVLRADQVRERVRTCVVGANSETLAVVVQSNVRVACFIISLTERSRAVLVLMRRRSSRKELLHFSVGAVNGQAILSIEVQRR